MVVEVWIELDAKFFIYQPDYTECQYLSLCLSVRLLPRFLPLHATREQNSDTRRFVAATASFLKRQFS